MERALGYVMITCLIRWMYNVCFLLLHWGNSFSYIKYGHSLPHCWEYTEINYKELTLNESVRQTWVSLCYCQICYDLVHGNACLSFICNKKLPVLGQRSLLGVNLKGHQNGWLNFCKRKHWILHREQCVWVKYVQFFVRNFSKWVMQIKFKESETRVWFLKNFAEGEYFETWFVWKLTRNWTGYCSFDPLRVPSVNVLECLTFSLEYLNTLI